MSEEKAVILWENKAKTLAIKGISGMSQEDAIFFRWGWGWGVGVGGGKVGFCLWERKDQKKNSELKGLQRSFLVSLSPIYVFITQTTPGLCFNIGFFVIRFIHIVSLSFPRIPFLGKRSLFFVVAFDNFVYVISFVSTSIVSVHNFHFIFYLLQKILYISYTFFLPIIINRKLCIYTTYIALAMYNIIWGDFIHVN